MTATAVVGELYVFIVSQQHVCYSARFDGWLDSFCHPMYDQVFCGICMLEVEKYSNAYVN
jgi:hypothetical protein